MTKDELKQWIHRIGIIPVVRATSPQMALDAAAAIKAGGVPILEITMTVPGAIDVIREVRTRFGTEVLVGAGTVLNPSQALQCIDAGAEFIVSPALNVATVLAVREAGIVMSPGALTPTEVLTAWEAGADYVKIFPCGNVGGAKYIKSLKAPFPYIEMIPTGGVNLNTAAEFLSAGVAALGVGADLVDAGALRDGRFEVVTENARQFAAIYSDFRAKQNTCAITDAVAATAS